MPQSTEIDQNAMIIWNYMLMHHQLKKADALLVLCSHDLRVAQYACDLFQEGYAPLVIFSGTSAHHDTKNDLLKTGWDASEARLFANAALTRGIPPDAILIEEQSTNTGDNIAFTRRLLEEKRIHITSFLVVQKPYMERRTFATFKQRWPEQNFTVTSPSITFEDYPNEDISKETMINIMVGDLQRIKEYPAKGFQIHQEIPKPVWQAYENLIALGYDKHLIKQ